MENELIVKLLKPFNLNSYEAKSYLALLRKESLTATEVAKISGVPRGRVYEVLNNLHDKGLCNLVSGAIKKYRAVNPEVFQRKIEQKVQIAKKEVEENKKEFNSELERKKQEFELNIENKKKKFENQLERKKLELIRMRESTNETVEILSEVYKKGRNKSDSMDYIEIMKDPSQIQKRFVELSESAEQEILVLSKRSQTQHFQEAGDIETIDRRTEIFEKKVKVRCVYDIWPDDNDNKMLFESIELFSKAGEEARIVDNLPMKLAIFDSKIVMFALVEMIEPMTGRKSSTVQVIEHPDMVESLKMLFESIWQQAKDYKLYFEKYRKKENK